MSPCHRFIFKGRPGLTTTDTSVRDPVPSAPHFLLAGAASGVAAVIHGLCPWLFQTTGSRTVKRLYHRLTGRGPGEAGYGDWEGAGG